MIWLAIVSKNLNTVNCSEAVEARRESRGAGGGETSERKRGEKGVQTKETGEAETREAQGARRERAAWNRERP